MPGITGFRIRATRDERLLLRAGEPEEPSVISTYREERATSSFVRALKNIGFFSGGLALASLSFSVIHGGLGDTYEPIYHLAFGSLFFAFYQLKKDRHQVSDPEINPQTRFILLQGSNPLPEANALQTPRFSSKESVLVLHILQEGKRRYFREENLDLITRRKIQSTALFFTEACSKYGYKAYNLSSEGGNETLISALFFILSLEIVFATFKTDLKETILLGNLPAQVEMA